MGGLRPRPQSPQENHLVIRVQTRDNEPVEKALRRLRKLCNNEGLTRKSKSAAYFEKPSEKRRREARERRKAIRLSMRARKQDLQKLLARRRKARKNARAARSDDSDVVASYEGRSEHGERPAFREAREGGTSRPRPPREREHTPAATQD